MTEILAETVVFSDVKTFSLHVYPRLNKYVFFFRTLRNTMIFLVWAILSLSCLMEQTVPSSFVTVNVYLTSDFIKPIAIYCWAGDILIKLLHAEER